MAVVFSDRFHWFCFPPLVIDKLELLSSIHYYIGLIENIKPGGDSPFFFLFVFYSKFGKSIFPTSVWSIASLVNWLRRVILTYLAFDFLIKNIRIQLLVIGAIALMPFLLNVLENIPGCSEWASLVRHFPFY